LEGAFVKYNSNNGWFKNDDSLESLTAQAFTHFTFAATKKQIMVTDIQGVGMEFTDPQIHSVDQSYGRGDLGQKGFQKFLESHNCNIICASVVEGNVFS